MVVSSQRAMLGALCSKSPEAFAEAETEAFKQLFAVGKVIEQSGQPVEKAGSNLSRDPLSDGGQQICAQSQ